MIGRCQNRQVAAIDVHCESLIRACGVPLQEVDLDPKRLLSDGSKTTRLFQNVYREWRRTETEVSRLAESLLSRI